ncbi:glycosyltransferase family 4 protein [Winogradskyella sp. F6397]|uniref:Glycosyltransferase family 4 protein n=1 Tax=Winogradskyella marina TaxID=2785530 RepID=A0ABS0EDI6_9FLAO|nr:glycosyltransferase family 4 protein [Winogradskyella marina]MBF8148507.1 glycosyltransferase family 4 protein [Winogradskyella marina]
MEKNKARLKILIIHNYTEGFATGGEANVFQDESNLLESNGHKVRKLFVTNSEGIDSSFLEKIKFFISSPWSNYGYSIVKKELKQFKPDIVHVHNFFFILSPKIFLAIWKEKIPVVVTLHNYRLVVPCSQMIYKGKPCDICLGKNPWRILIRRCYRNSFFASLFRYRFYFLSQKKHNWWKYIDRFIALTENGKSILIKGGLPSSKIIVKQNFIEDPKPQNIKIGHGALYIGTLTVEKGIKELIHEWQSINYPLKVIGAGELRRELTELNKNENISFLGVVPREQVIKELEDCAFIVMPSICQESFGLVNIEALSMGKPVLASWNGGMRDIIQDGENGYFIDINQFGDLKKKINHLIKNPTLLKEMGQNARSSYLLKYTSQINYELLINIYTQTIDTYENN